MRILASILALNLISTAILAQPIPIPLSKTQVAFSKPSGMKVYWQTKKDGKTVFSKVPLETPGKFNFTQGALYQLKLTHIPGHAGLELYPTLEVVRASPRASEYVNHNSIPLQLAEDDFKQVVDGKFIVKAVYLPSAQFQDVSGNIDEIASTRLEPGQDPIREAARRGEILLVLRMGNIRKE